MNVAATNSRLGRDLRAVSASGGLRLERMVTLLAACGLLGLSFGILFHRSGAGFDLTDEGFYLNWIYTPWNFQISTTLFGFFYHPLALLLDFDVGLLRRVNLVVTVALSAALMWVLLRDVIASPFGRAICSVSFGVGGLLLLQFWLPTPNYNGLTLHGLLLIATGMAWLLTTNALGQIRQTAVAASLIGIGGWMAAMGKPSAGVFAGVMVALALLAAFPPRALLVLLIAGASALVMGMLTAFAIDGSIGAFIARLQRSAASIYTVSPTYSILRLDTFEIEPFEERNAAIALAVGVAWALACRFVNHWASLSRAVLLILAAAFAGALCWRGDLATFAASPNQAIVLLALCFGAVIGLWPRFDSSATARRRIALALFLFVQPYVFAVGTGNNIWWHAQLAAVFFPASALALIAVQTGAPVAERAIVGLSLIVASVTLVFVAISMESPYRQVAALRSQNVPVPVGPHGSQLRMTERMASYAAAARAVVRAQANASAPTIVDTTGRNPGTIFLAGAVALGAPWLIGGYKGSNQQFATVLKGVPCEALSRALLIAAPGDPLQFSDATLAAEGIVMARDFIEVGRAVWPIALVEHVWLRPQSSANIVAACAEARAAPPRG